MSKCKACQKFMSPKSAEAVSCTKCAEAYHRSCVRLPAAGERPRGWLCPECKRCVPRDNRTDTPVKGLAEDGPAAAAAASSPDDGELNMRAELRLLRQEMSSWRGEIRRDLAAATAELREFRAEFVDLRRTVAAVDERIGAVEKRLDELERRSDKRMQAGGSKALEDALAKLEAELAERDQDLLANDVQIAGIPEAPGENAYHVVKLVGAKLGVVLDEHDAVSATRMGARREDDRPRPLVVRLARRSTRDALLAAARVRRGATTADLGLSGPPRRFYVNERLTRLNRQLLGKARERAREAGWKHVWTREGRVRARQTDGSTVHYIRTEENIQTVFSKPSV